MKKFISLTLLLCTLVLLLSSCGSRNAVKIEKPEDTNLEYWLLDNPDKEDLTLIYGIGYLSNNYQPIVNEDGSLGTPKEYVAFSFASYPTQEIGADRILLIKITDPNVSVWGLTVNSTEEQIVEIFSKMGFYIENHLEERCVVKTEQIEIIFHYGEFIHIQQKVISIANSIYFFDLVYDRSFPYPKIQK